MHNHFDCPQPEFTEILLRDAPFRRAIQQLTQGQSISVDGVFGGVVALASAAIANQTSLATKPLLILTPQAADAEKIADDLELFTKRKPILFPAVEPKEPIVAKTESDQDTASDSESDNEEIVSKIFSLADDMFGQRVRVLKTLVANNASVVVAGVPALLQKVPNVTQIAEKTQTLQVGAALPLEPFKKFLVGGGYHATSAVELPGEFAVRGYILDLFAPDWEHPIRIEFFGDEIETMRRFDIATQRSLDTVTEISLTRLHPNDPKESTLLDYLPNDAPLILVEPREIEKAGRTFLERINPSKNFLTVSDLLREVLKRPTATFSHLAEGMEEVHCRIPTASVERLRGNIETVKRELDLLEGEDVCIFCPTEAEIKRLTELFGDIKPFQEKRLHLLQGRLSAGFRIADQATGGQAKGVIVIGSGELFQRHDIRRPKSRTLGQVIDSFIDLTSGDFVVHVAHGIARYRGIVTLTKGQQEEEHLLLEFAEGQTLYVPTSKIGLVQKYVAGSKVKPKLAKLGGQLWAKQKKSVQAAVFDLAEEMIDLQAKRQLQQGIQFPEDSDWQREFDAQFPFRETNDQLLAIEAIKNDMMQPRPMDRLLCGDVGFGKTEVAIRAAFKAVDAGYQVAVLVPTTILAEQHYRTFSERMSEFPITVAPLSRFQSAKEQKATLEELAKGKIDIVIGTHRIVSADVKFYNLGLVVIDEEQRFGVAHKERLKMFRSIVDVLTMTATPIPRTLHLSLLGIREISNLETPPEDRLPVETRVVRFNRDIIRNAVLRELNRGGQLFFVHNRVSDIKEIADTLQRIVPEARIGIGHAQMPVENLEEVMHAFIEHEFDLLVCTTIIESGLDIPNANTIFIDEASHYGLADLHQLRGRVGRYKNQAYCYLLLQANQPLTSQASKRLHAIEEYAHLGSGFHLAMRDLEIRGAGNILGMQQSGHISAVGYEMYCQFLETAIRTLKRMPPKTMIDVELDLPGLAMLPKSYIEDQRQKIDLYRRLTRVTTYQELLDLRNEIVDRFGKPPMEVERLLQHSEIRLYAHHYRIRSIHCEKGLGDDQSYIVLEYASKHNMQQLRDKLQSRGETIRFTANMYAYIPIDYAFPNELNEYCDDVIELIVDLLR